MFVLDSSVLIDYLNDKNTLEVNILERLLGLRKILIPNLVFIEVLQGIKNEKEFIKTSAFLQEFDNPEIDLHHYKKAAIENYRKLRSKGITIGTIDNIIATYCITNNLPLLFSDRDYRYSVKHLGLRDFSKEVVN